MPYILDRDGLEYYHRRRKWLLFGDLYDVTFTGDYNVNQTTIAKLKVRKQSSEVQTDTNDIEFPDVYCEAEVTPDTGYTAGEATVTREGNLFIVDVDNADIRLAILTIDPTPMGSLSIPFALPDGTVQYVQTSTSESVTVQLPVGSTVANYSLPPYSGYSSYVNGTQTNRIKNYVVSGDQTLSIVYQLDEYGISVYFVDGTNHTPLVVSWTAEITHPETGVVTTTTGTSSVANITAPVGAQYTVTGVPPTGYTTPRPSVSGTVLARNVELTVTFIRISTPEDPEEPGKPEPIMSIETQNIRVGKTENIIVNFNPTDVTGTCTATVNSSVYTDTITNGVAHILISGLSKGAYSVEVTYSGDNNYASVTDSASFKVSSESI